MAKPKGFSPGLNICGLVIHNRRLPLLRSQPPPRSLLQTPSGPPPRSLPPLPTSCSPSPPDSSSTSSQVAPSASSREDSPLPDGEGFGIAGSILLQISNVFSPKIRWNYYNKRKSHLEITKSFRITIVNANLAWLNFAIKTNGF